jgi:hypothetical protein
VINAYPNETKRSVFANSNSRSLRLPAENIVVRPFQAISTVARDRNRFCPNRRNSGSKVVINPAIAC